MTTSRLESVSEYGIGCWPLKNRPHVSGPIHALNAWGLPICGTKSPINQKITLLMDATLEDVCCSVCQAVDYRIHEIRMKAIRGAR